MTLDYNQQRKLQLIEDILKIIFPQRHPNNIILENDQRISFTMRYIGPVETRFEIIWNNNLDFEIWKIGKVRFYQHTISSSQWFKVRDLLRKRFLDAEKLKYDGVEK